MYKDKYNCKDKQKYIIVKINQNYVSSKQTCVYCHLHMVNNTTFIPSMNVKEFFTVI